MAQAHDFISRFPEGYDSIVGQRGVNLSGGQRQRIAIARALLSRPAVLIFDDSTSAVDVETEARIQAALADMPVRPTRVVVAQRISTVLSADKILVLDDGRVAAQGTHAQLLESSPIYREIYESQMDNGAIIHELSSERSAARPRQSRRRCWGAWATARAQWASRSSTPKISAARSCACGATCGSRRSR